MKRKLLLEGLRFNIYGVVVTEGGLFTCPAESFIDQMSEASRKSLLSVLHQHANGGPILNQQKSRMLRNGIFEFKSRQGDRLLWFYPPAGRRETVITHGFHKGSRIDTEIRRAERLRDIYLREAD